MMWLINGAAAFIFACLAGLGVGGGGLLVLWLTFAGGTDQFAAQGINIAFYIFAAAASLPVHIKSRTIDMKAVIPVALTAVVGSVAGCLLAQSINAELLRRMFGGFLLASGGFVIIRELKKR